MVQINTAIIFFEAFSLKVCKLNETVANSFDHNTAPYIQALDLDFIRAYIKMYKRVN